MSATTWGRRGRAPIAAASFAIARIRARPSRGLVTGLGIAIAVASLFVTTGLPVIAGDVTLRRALQDLPSGDRSVTVAVSVNHKTPEQLQAIDEEIRNGLHAPGLGAIRRQIEYRALAAPDGSLFRLAGIERLAETVVLRDGRLPQQCVPTRCEVVVVGDVGTTVALPPELDIVVVGHVDLIDDSLLAGGFRPEPEEIVLLGDGVDAVGAIAPLDLIGRSLGWIAPIDPASVRVSQVDDVLAAAATTANSFSEGGATVDLPRDALVVATARAATASQRVSLAAAQGVVLLVAFALLAASGSRRQHRDARQLLLQRGASRSTVNVFTVFEAAWPVLVGLVVGVPLGLGVTSIVAARSNLSGSDIVSTVVSDSAVRVLVGAVLLLAATSVVIAASQSTASGRVRRPWWRPMAIDGVGVGALCVGALAIARGDTTPASLVADGDPLVATLPILAALTMAWLAIRTVPLLVATAARSLRHRAPLARAALGEVGRRPIVPLATAGFLAAATTLGVFSLGYRSTLAQGAHDQAAYVVPYDITLSSGRALVRPLAVEPAGGWSTLAPGVGSTDVLRRSATTKSQTATTDSLTVLGIDPATLPLLRGWRDDFGPSPSTIAALIAAPTVPAPLGTPIPAGVAALELMGSGDLGGTDITVIVSRVDGTWHEVDADFSSDHGDRLTATLDDGDAGGRFIGVRIGQLERSEQLTQHATGEGDAGVDSFRAAVRFDSVQTVGAPGTASSVLPVDLTTLRSDDATVTVSGSSIDVAVELQGESAFVLPPTDPAFRTMPAIVDPVTASNAVNGIVPIDLATGERRSIRVVGVATHFPGAPDRFVVLDRHLAQPSFDLLQPGFGTANELWIGVDHDDLPALRRALAVAPFSDLVIADRASIERHLRTDPLAEFTLGLFAVAGMIAAALAVAAVYLAAQSDAADQAPLHRALAAEGVAPRSLSRMVRTAALAIAIGAITLGTVGALVFLRLVTRVIAVTATSTVPVPPLVASLSAAELTSGLAALAIPSAIAAALAARAARTAAEGDLLREFG